MRTDRTEIGVDGKPCWHCEIETPEDELRAQGDHSDPTTVDDVIGALSEWDLAMGQPLVQGT